MRKITYICNVCGLEVIEKDVTLNSLKQTSLSVVAIENRFQHVTPGKASIHICDLCIEYLRSY